MTPLQRVPGVVGPGGGSHTVVGVQQDADAAHYQEEQEEQQEAHEAQGRTLFHVACYGQQPRA